MPGCRGAFTFVELLVVVAIIMVVMGLLAAWAVGARRSWQRHATESAVNTLLLVADAARNASPILPDHRLANFFWIQPHDPSASAPVWLGINCRRMSSGEFLTFVASLATQTNTMLTGLGPKYLPASPVSGSWGMAPDPAGPWVDVFEQDPAHASALDKDKNSAAYSLVSPKEGYHLRAPVDAWGNGLLYRLNTDRDGLNQADTDAAPLQDFAGNPNGTYKVREDILQDEQFTRDRYVAMGVPVDVSTATASTKEYVRPAVPAYALPSFMSAGPDGVWGAFTDPARDPQADLDAARDRDAKDNIYSQETGR